MQVGYSGVDSMDGDGCSRNAIKTVDAGSRRGMHLAVGEGADVFVTAGGERRGQSAGILDMAASLEQLLNATSVNAAAIVSNRVAVEVGMGALDTRLSGSTAELSAEVVALVEDEILTAKVRPPAKFVLP